MKRILFLATMMVVLSCSKSKVDNSFDTDSLAVLAFDEEIDVVPQNRVVDAKAQYLIENGLNPNADITDEQMKEIKELIEYGTFDEISFCQAFNDFLPMNSIESENYLKKFKLPKGRNTQFLSIILSFQGQQLCK